MHRGLSARSNVFSVSQRPGLSNPRIGTTATLFKGMTHDVTWLSTGRPFPVAILLYRGTTLVSLVATSMSTTGVVPFTIPPEASKLPYPSGEYYIVVSSTRGDLETTGAVFQIANPTAISTDLLRRRAGPTPFPCATKSLRAGILRLVAGATRPLSLSSFRVDPSRALPGPFLAFGFCTRLSGKVVEARRKVGDKTTTTTTAKNGLCTLSQRLQEKMAILRTCDPLDGVLGCNGDAANCGCRMLR